MAGEQQNREIGKTVSFFQQPRQKEYILAAIALLLGKDTDEYARVRASQHLAGIGPEILPMLVQALHLAPAITTLSWSWWPPQYAQISRLLIQLSQRAHLSLEDLLHMPDALQPPGPVLWTCVIEAAGLLPHMEYEPLLRAGLVAPCWSVRYAAATAIARRATHISLCPEMRQALYQCQQSDDEVSVRLVAASALLRCGESSGLEALLPFLKTPVAAEVRKATLFILATELPVPLAPQEKQQLAELLLIPLRDADPRIALLAARALHSVANADTLPALDMLLDHPCSHSRLAALAALEELASRKTMRYAIQQQQIAQHIASLLHEPELRRQACYTLATLGGEYTTATLGTLVLDDEHPAHLAAIEALRLLPEVQRPAILTRALRWLLHALAQPDELAQICALDSLSSLIWQARAQHRWTTLRVIAGELLQRKHTFPILTSTSAWVRQRTIELLSLLDPQLVSHQIPLLAMLHTDSNADVRTSIISALGKAAAYWAIPDLLQALLDDDESVAQTALDTLATHPLLDNALLIYTLKELAVYHLPLSTLRERKQLAHAARIWLKKKEKEK